MAKETSGSGRRTTKPLRRRTGPGAPAAVLAVPADEAGAEQARAADEAGSPSGREVADQAVSYTEPDGPSAQAAVVEDRPALPRRRGGFANGISTTPEVSSPRPPSAIPAARRDDVEPAAEPFDSVVTDRRIDSTQGTGQEEPPAWRRAGFGSIEPASAEHPEDLRAGPHEDADVPAAHWEAAHWEAAELALSAGATPSDTALPEPEPPPTALALDPAPRDEEPAGTGSSRSAWDWMSLSAFEPVAEPVVEPPAHASTSPVDAPAGPPADDTSTDPHGLMLQRYFAPVLYRTVARPSSAGRSARRGLFELVVVGLVAALIGGGIGGAVGFTLAGGRADPGSPGALAGPLPEPASAESPLGPAESVAAKVLPSVVQLRVDGTSSAGEGSGMVLSPDGLLLTNNHVVESAARGGKVTAVMQDGTTAPVDIIGRDPSFDLAVLRARNVSGLIPIELGNSDNVRVGQQVVAFGSPLGLGGTVTTGIISAINRPVSVGGDRVTSDATVLNALQTDAAINPGNSGGPLVDMRGQLIGINSAIATTGAEGGSIGVGFAIPVNQARRVAAELERTGKASRAQLGVSVGDDPTLSGARIRSVDPGSAAEKAGLQAGDLVLRFGGQRILAGEGLQAAVRSRAPQETVEVELSDRTISVTLGGSP